MKNGWNSKNFIIVIMLFSGVLLAGYIFYKPVLKNADKPFIELSGSVGTAIGNAQGAYYAANVTEKPAPTGTEMPSSTPKPSITAKPTTTPTPLPSSGPDTPAPSNTPVPTVVPTLSPTPTPIVPTEARIIVADEQVSSNGLFDGNVEDFKTEFQKEHGVFKGLKIILIDDYAEAKSFRRMIRLIKESGVEYEIEINKENERHEQ